MASGNFEHRRDCYHLIFIIPRCALSANQSATAGALDPTHWTSLTVADLGAMDPLSYFTTRSLMGSRIANEDFEKCLSKHRQQPTTPLVSLIWGQLAGKAGAPRHADGQYDLYRDVGEICDFLFERKDLPSFIGNIYNGPLPLQAEHVDSAHNLQDLIDSCPPCPDARRTDGALQAFEIVKFSNVKEVAFAAACTSPFVSGLGTQDWVKEEAKRILASDRPPVGKKAKRGKGKKDQHLECVQEAIHRQSLGFVFLSMYPEEAVGGFDNSRDLPASMMASIASYGIKLAVELGLVDKRCQPGLIDAVSACIPKNLTTKYPSPRVVDQEAPRTLLDFATAVRVLVVLHAGCVERARVDHQEVLDDRFANKYTDNLRSSSPQIIFPENMTVRSNGVDWTIRSVDSLSNAHFTTVVFSTLTSGSTGAPTLTRLMTKYDDLKNPSSPRAHDVSKVLSNVVRVICSRIPAVAAPAMSVSAAATTIMSSAAPTASAVAVKGSVASAAVGMAAATPSKIVGSATTTEFAAGAPNSSVTATAAMKANPGPSVTATAAVRGPLPRAVLKAKIDDRMTAIMNVAMPDDNVLGRIEVRSSQANSRIFRLECQRDIIYRNSGGETKEVFSGNMKRRYTLLENQTSNTWTELACAEISSDNWEETVSPNARLSKWSLPFTRKKGYDMRLHHIFITSIFECVRRVYVKAICIAGRVKCLNEPNIPQFQLHFDIEPCDLFKGASYDDRGHLWAWGKKKTALWDKTDLCFGWSIPPLIDEVYSTVSNYKNPEEELSISFVM